MQTATAIGITRYYNEINLHYIGNLLLRLDESAIQSNPDASGHTEGPLWSWLCSISNMFPEADMTICDKYVSKITINV